MMLRASLSIVLLLACFGVARADVEINARKDTVVLNDGTEIQCYILMTSQSGVVIIETNAKDPEKKTQRTIARNTIRNIVIGERSARTEELLTDTEYARKVVLGSGVRPDEAADTKAAAGDKSDGAKHAVTAKKSKTKKKARAAADDAPDEKVAAKTTAPKADAAAAAKPAAPGDVTADAAVVLPPDVVTPKELVDAYVNRFPDLQTAALDIVGEERLNEWLDSAKTGKENPRQPLDAILNAYMGNAAEVTKSSAPIRGAMPARMERYAHPDPAK